MGFKSVILTFQHCCSLCNLSRSHVRKDEQVACNRCHKKP